MCATCVAQASPLLTVLPYGLTAAAAVALGRVGDRGRPAQEAGPADPEAPR